MFVTGMPPPTRPCISVVTRNKDDDARPTIMRAAPNLRPDDKMALTHTSHPVQFILNHEHRQRSAKERSRELAGRDIFLQDSCRITFGQGRP